MSSWRQIYSGAQHVFSPQIKENSEHAYIYFAECSKMDRMELTAPTF